MSTAHLAPRAPDGLPPPPAAHRVFREQLRTALLGWSAPEWAVLGALLAQPIALFLLWGQLFPEPAPEPTQDGIWLHSGGVAAGYLVAMALSFCVAAVVWRPRGNPFGLDRENEGKDGRWGDAFLAQPIDQAQHLLLRAGAGAVWVLLAGWVALSLGVLIEWSAAGTWSPLTTLGWIGVLGGPMVLYLLMSAGSIRTAGMSKRSTVVLGATALLAILGPALPGGDAVVRPLFFGELGLVTALVGGEGLAVLLWIAVAGGLLLWQAGRPLDAASGEAAGTDRAKRSEAQGPGHLHADPTSEARASVLRMPARLRDSGPPSGRLPPRPSPASVLLEHGRSLRESIPASYLLMYLACGLALGAIWIEGVVLSDPATWSGALGAPGLLIRATAIAAVFLLCGQDRAHSSPAAYQNLAPPVARRTWIIPRVGLLVAIVVVAALAAQIAAEVMVRVVGFGDGLRAGPAGLAQTAGLVVAFGLFSAALATPARQPLRTLLFLALLAPVILLVLLSAFRMPTELLEVLFMRGVFSGQPAPGAHLGLAGWIVLSAAVLWFATGRRAME
jgi:hypothetical protein